MILLLHRTKNLCSAWYHIPGIRVRETTPVFEYANVRLFRTSIMPLKSRLHTEKYITRRPGEGAVLERRNVLDFMHGRCRMTIYPGILKRRNRACRVFTDQADIACTMSEAS